MVEQLEPRCLPASVFPVGGLAVGDVNGAGAPSLVSVTDPGVPTALQVIYGGSKTNQAAFPSTVNNAQAVQMPAGLALSQINQGAQTQPLFPFGPTFTGGASVACGDFFGTGFNDIAVAAGPGGMSQVVIYSGRDLVNPNGLGKLTMVASFFAITPHHFSGGMTVAANVLDNTGKANLIVGAGPGGGPQVGIFTFTPNGTTYLPVLLSAFHAFSDSYTGGVSVATGALFNSLNNGTQYILVGQMSGAQPMVTVWDPSVGPSVAPLLAGTFTVALPGGASGVLLTAVTQTWIDGMVAVTPASGDADGTISLYTPTDAQNLNSWSHTRTVKMSHLGMTGLGAGALAIAATGFIYNSNPVLIARPQGSANATAFCIDLNPYYFLPPGKIPGYNSAVMYGDEELARKELKKHDVDFDTQHREQHKHGFLSATYYNQTVGTYSGGSVTVNTDSPHTLAILPVNVPPVLQSIANLPGMVPVVPNFAPLNFMTDTQRAYQSPYALNLPATAQQLGLLTNPADWGPTSYDRKSTDAYGPSINQYKVDPSVAQLSGLEQAQRLFAMAQLLLGQTMYQHHHDPAFLGIPELPPYPSFVFDPNDNMRQTPGLDCTDFTSFVYNFALGIEMNSATNTQANLKTVTQHFTDGTTRTLSTNSTPIPAEHQTQEFYNALIQTLQPGDLLYISGTGPGQATSTKAAHGIIFLGFANQPGSLVTSTSPNDLGTPLIMDCTGQEHTDANGVQVPNGVHIRPFAFQGANSWYFDDLLMFSRIIPTIPNPGPTPGPIPGPTALSLGAQLITPSFPGSTATLTGSISADPSSALTVSVNWGDGTPPTVTMLAAGTNSYELTHAYENPGHFQVTVTATDTLNNTATANTTARVTANNLLATGAGTGGSPQVNVYDARTGALLTSFNAFAPTFTGGVRVAVGDVNGDGIPDIICAAGPGGGPQVNVYDGQSFQLVRSFFAFDPAFTGGVYVAAGDINRDGIADIICGAGEGGGPQVSVYDGMTGRQLLNFYAFNSNFTGGVRVAAADFSGRQHADIVCAAGPGGGPQVTVYSAENLSVLASFYAYNPKFTGGVFVAAGDVDGDGHNDIITGAGAGGGPQVNVFSNPVLIDGDLNGDAIEDQVGGRDAVGVPNLKVRGDGAAVPTAAFDALPPTFTGGVRVGATASIDGVRLAIATSAGPGGGPEVALYEGKTLALVDSFFAYNATFTGGVFVS